jgi:hypothetical protein
MACVNQVFFNHVACESVGLYRSRIDLENKSSNTLWLYRSTGASKYERGEEGQDIRLIPVYFSTLKLEATYSAETSADFLGTTRCYMPIIPKLTDI